MGASASQDVAADRYSTTRTIGHGTFGKVEAAIDTRSGAEVAVKTVELLDAQQRGLLPRLRMEIAALALLRGSAHVVQLVEVLASQTSVHIVLELISGGNLLQLIVREGALTQARARKHLRDVVAGLAHCHACGVCHRDIKPENLLIDAFGRVRLSDFGFAEVRRAGFAGAARSDAHGSASDGLLYATCGTPNYAAPEVFSGAGYDGFLADVWSCGVLLLVLLTGKMPFDHPSMRALLARIAAAEYTMPTSLSSDAKDLISKILEPDPSRRFTLRQVAQHPWLRSEAADDDAVQPEREPTEGAAAMAPRPTGQWQGADDVDEHVNAFGLLARSDLLDMTVLLAGPSLKSA